MPSRVPHRPGFGLVTNLTRFWAISRRNRRMRLPPAATTGLYWTRPVSTSRTIKKPESVYADTAPQEFAIPICYTYSFPFL